MTAAEQLNRIVQLVAELTKRDRERQRPATLSELAKRFGTTTAQIQSDIRTLTLVCDDVEADWLSSIRAWQEGDTVWLSSAGPFRRPIRFTADEMLALATGLATEEDGGRLAAQLAAVTRDLISMESANGPLVDLVLNAVTARQCVEILYAGERTRDGSRRVIHPHQVAAFAGHVFVAAWCERAADWRHFRLDRVIDMVALDRSFTMRDDFQRIEHAAALFRGDDTADDVKVRFSREVARWMVERYAHAEQQPDGGATVTYRVADVNWLIRRILQYGPEAEVLEPHEYREAMRRAMAG